MMHPEYCRAHHEHKCAECYAEADRICRALAECREPLVEDDTYKVWLAARAYADGAK
jgi:hypothetical protein